MQIKISWSIIAIVTLTLGAEKVISAENFTEDVTFVDGDVFFSVEIHENAHAEVLGGRFDNRLQLYDNATAHLVGGDIRGAFAMEGLSRASIHPDILQFELVTQ